MGLRTRQLCAWAAVDLRSPVAARTMPRGGVERAHQDALVRQAKGGRPRQKLDRPARGGQAEMA
eukprot:7148975-Pyramimonas_sp.AAC.1